MQVIVHAATLHERDWLRDFLGSHGGAHFPVLPVIPADYRGLVLGRDDAGLSLHAAGQSGVTPTRVDFLAGAVRHRVHTSRKSAGLPKAAGLDKLRPPPRVLDATAGLGIDAYLLAAMGCEVTLLEKSPVMGALLEDGLRRARECGDTAVRESVARMSLHVADAHDWMRQATEGARPDVITLDPMFPPRQKSAKVKKDMALMQTLLPPNEDIDALLDGALQLAARRVVLKRPGRESLQEAPKPDFQVPGKACHFQVFLTG